jgi:hypothetical protein
MAHRAVFWLAGRTILRILPSFFSSAAKPGAASSNKQKDSPLDEFRAENSGHSLNINH